ncbi:MAG TPA: hypothetical protein VHW72_16400 [Candidatus Angelobacter sp.]|jgi:hypothetical protein|nr:hypothetical protein [Candidatus Angelobacter sp.]
MHSVPPLSKFWQLPDFGNFGNLAFDPRSSAQIRGKAFGFPIT